MDNSKIKIYLISSSGGHYEQLKRLKPLEDQYDVVWITEKTGYKSAADYYLLQTGLKDKFYMIKMIWNFLYSLVIWIKEKPEFIITTGSMIVIPSVLFAKLFKKKIIYIETFARVNTESKTGKFVYKFADLFIVQWEELKSIYPNAVYGGSIY